MGSGELKWKEAVRHVLLTRPGNAKGCVTDLIDHMITVAKRCTRARTWRTSS
jgi:hypothetical protein